MKRIRTLVQIKALINEIPWWQQFGLEISINTWAAEDVYHILVKSHRNRHLTQAYEMRQLPAEATEEEIKQAIIEMCANVYKDFQEKNPA